MAKVVGGGGTPGGSGRGHSVVTQQGDPTWHPVAHARPDDTLPDWWALLHVETGGLNSIASADMRLNLSNAVAPDTLLPVCYGQVRIGGTVLAQYSPMGEDLISGGLIIAWCEGPIESIDAFLCNGSELTAFTRPDTLASLGFAHYTGGPGEPGPGNYIATGRLPAVAFTDIQLYRSPVLGCQWWKLLPGGAQDAKYEWAADIHGLRLYDPRQDSTNGGSGAHRYADPTTWSYGSGVGTSPALIVRHLLRTYGRLAETEIDDVSIAAAATACYTAGFTCNVAFATKTVLRDALAVVLQTCNGVLITSNGKVGLYLDIPNPGAPAGTFLEEDGDVWGLRYEWLSARDRYTQVAVSFANKDANYKGDTTPIFGEPGSFSSEPPATIASVDTGTDTVTLVPSPGWAVNDTVLFFQNSGAEIPGLHDGQTYYVKTIAGADVTLALVAGGVTVNLTGSPVITTQYLQRVGAAYPPAIVPRLIVVNAPGINTLAAAIILRDYLYNASAITFRISGTMNARGITLQQGQKIRLSTLKGVNVDCLLVQISGDQAGFFQFVAKPYDADVYGTTPINQGPPVVTPPPNPTTPGGDITVTDASTTRQVTASNTSNTTVYDLYQLIKYTLPTTGTALASLVARGFRGAGAATKTWDDMVASEVSIPLTGNEPPPDASHLMLSMPGVIKTVRTLTFDMQGQLIQTVDATGPTRIMIKTVTPADARSTGVTVDVAESTDTTTNPRTDVPLWKWVKSTTAANGSTKTFAIPTKPVASTLLVVADGQPLVDSGFSPGDGADYSLSGLNVTIASGRAAPSSYVAFFYQESVEP